MLALNRKANAAITTVASDLRADTVPEQAAVRGEAVPAPALPAMRFDPALLDALAPPNPMVNLLWARVRKVDLTGTQTADGTEDR